MNGEYDVRMSRINEMNVAIGIAFHGAHEQLTNLYDGSLEGVVREAIALFGDERVWCRHGLALSESVVLVDDLIFGVVSINAEIGASKIEVVTRKVRV